MNLPIMIAILMVGLTLPSGGAAIRECVYPCPDDWRHFQGNCYRYYSNQVTWQQAREGCSAAGADLVSIHSEPENRFAYDLITPKTATSFAWIGYYQYNPASFGNYYWSDGTPTNFEAWKPLLPDNTGQQEGCAHFVTDVVAKWNDWPCSRTLGYICKKAPTY